MALHVKLTSKLAPNNLVSLIKQIGKENFYPVEECLQICNAAGDLEASALLNLEIGSYQESIKLYLKVLKRDLNVRAFRKELFFLQNHRRTKRTKLPNILIFETIIAQIKKIIVEHPDEVL